MTEFIWLAVGIGAAGSGLLAGLLVVRARAAGQWQRDLVCYELRFPRGLDPKAVEQFVAGLTGLLTPHGRRALAMRSVMVEASAAAAGIGCHLLVRRPDAQIVLSALRATLPGVRVREDTAMTHPGRPATATELALSTTRRMLGVDQPGIIAARILASLQPLGHGEHIVIQWSARPVGVPQLVQAALPPRQTGGLLKHLLDVAGGRETDPQAVQSMRTKQASPLFVAAGRIGVWAATPERARALLARVTAAFHAVSAPGVHLHRRQLPAWLVGRALVQRWLPVLTYPCVLNATELAALLAVPTGELTLPGLRLGGTRQLAPAADIPTHGRVVATASFPGAERPLALSVVDSLRHLHVIGPTGSGKSTLLTNLITQDMAAGRGVVVVDPKGDLVADVLDRVPPQRRGEVVVLDPTDETRPVGLNLLAGADRDPELASEQVVGIFHQLYRAFWGPRTDDILRAALLTLAMEPGMTLCEVPLLLTDPGFRRRLVGRVEDPVALGPFWGWYEGMSDAERAGAIGPVMNKLRAFLLRRRLRNILGQATPKLDLDEALTHRKIVLVPLAKGLLGEEAAALVGSLVVARVWQAVQRRAGLAPEQRPTTFAFIDEFQDYLHLPVGVADLLAQARSLGLGLTLAHQHLGQLPPAIREAVLANARSRVIFQTAAGDARALARELGPHLTAADLQGLGPYEVVATLSTGNRVAPPVTGMTQPAPTATGRGDVVRAASRTRYGTDRDEVEAAIRVRHEGRPGGGRVGRREMSS